MEITLKVANMAKAAEFTLYPYNGGENINLQSDKRFIIANIRTGKAYINKKGINYPNGFHTMASKLEFKLEPKVLADILAYIHAHVGVNNIGGTVNITNQPLPADLITQITASNENNTAI